MPRRSGLEYWPGPENGEGWAGLYTADIAVDARCPKIWYGAVRIGLSLVWDSPEKSWYRRVPP